MPKPRGSGYFALTFGALFIVTFVISLCVKLYELCPYYAFQAWLVFAAVILIVWGAVRIATGGPSKRVGQDTINFVVGIVGVTIALLTLVAAVPACH